MKNRALVSIGSKFGAIAGSISIIYGVIGYVISPELFTNWIAAILMMISSMVILVVGVIQARKSYSHRDGSFPFRSAFTVFTLGGFVLTLMGVIFNVLLFNVIDPEFKIRIQEDILNKTVSMMERFGAPDEAIDQAIAQAEENDQFSIANQIKSIPWAIMMYAVIGLLVAAIIRRKGNIFTSIDSAQ